MVGELCGCIEDRKQTHGKEMGGLQGIVEVIILSYRLQRRETREVEVPSTRTKTRSERIHFSVQEARHLVGYLFGRSGSGDDVAWRNF
jgi:hypothetical protein